MIILKGGTVFGEEVGLADVAVEHGRIVQLGDIDPSKNDRVVDCTGSWGWTWFCGFARSFARARSGMEGRYRLRLSGRCGWRVYHGCRHAEYATRQSIPGRWLATCPTGASRQVWSGWSRPERSALVGPEPNSPTSMTYGKPGSASSRTTATRSKMPACCAERWST